MMPGRREEFLFEKYRGSDLSKYMKWKKCAGNQSLHKTKPRMKNTFISVKEIQESNLTKEQRFETFEHPEDLLTLKIA